MRIHMTKKTNSQTKKVLVTGVFDVLHTEHKTFLQKAKQLGYLLVGVESDVRVADMKGPGRPIHSQNERVKNLQALGIADEVFVLPEDFSLPEHHRNLIQSIQPDYLAVSSHTKHIDKKQKIMNEFGGSVVVVHEHNPEVSTTLLLANQIEVSN